MCFYKTTIKTKQVLMKTKILFLSLLFILVGCSSEDDGKIIADNVPIQFSAYTISKEGVSNVEDVWGKDDAVGIFMIENEKKLSSSTILDGADNKQYWAKVIAGKAFFDAATPQDVIYYLRNEKVDFVAYYPYSKPLANYILPIDVSNQSDQRKLDLLYSNNAKDIEYSEQPVDLIFEHKLSKLNFSVKAGIGAPDITNASIIIDGLNTQADFNLADGTISNTHTLGTIVANNNSALVIPQPVGDVKLTVAINDDRFESTISTNEFLSGKIHSYIITVNKTGISISVRDITDWIGKDDDPINGGAEAQEYEIGDYYPDPEAVYENGELVSGNPAIGVVYWILPHSANKHGKIISLDQAYETWGQFVKTGAEHDTHGIYNMETIARLNDWASYPAFNWIHNKNKDTSIDYTNIYARGVWYFPAIDELLAMYIAYMKHEKISTSLQHAAGDPFVKRMYSSSTGYSSSNADAIQFETGKVTLHGKKTKSYIRGVLAF